jgi:hypothetical protein
MPKRRQTRAGARPRSGGQRPPGNPAGRPGPPGGSPAPAGRPVTPGASETRQAMERVSAKPLIFLQHLPRWVPPIAVLALLITGLAVPGWIGAVAFVLVAAFLAWLGYLSWPTISSSGRLLRIAAVGCLLALAAVQAVR